MASSIQLLRSTIAQERPFPGNLLEGQPAVNLNASEPGLFFKAADGSLVKFGPAAITSDGSPPNSSPQGSAGNTIGELWLDKSVDPAVLKVYDGTTWVDAGSGGGGGGGGGGSASFLRWIYTAVGGETSLSGSSGGVLLEYTPGLEEVYVNGVLITRGTDYSATNGTSITNLSALTAGDVITVTSLNPLETVQLPGQVTLLRWTVLATSGQTVLSGVDSLGQQLAYTSGLEEVYVNGAFLRRGTDYIATDGSTITGLSPLAENDEITVMAWTPFVIGDLITNSSVAANAEIESTKLRFTPSGSGAVSTTVQSKLRETVSVLDFGADNTGATDSTAAVQAAINSSQKIYFPGGTYLVDGLSISGNNKTLIGDNMRGTSIRVTTAAPGWGITLSGSQHTILDLQFEGLDASRNIMQTSGGTFNLRFDRVRFFRCAIGLDVVSNFYWSTFTDCYWRDCGIGVRSLNGQSMNAITFSGCTFWHFAPTAATTGDCLDINGSEGITLNGCHAQNQGIKFTNVNGISVNGGYWECYDRPAFDLNNSQVTMNGVFLLPGTIFKTDEESASRLLGYGPQFLISRSGFSASATDFTPVPCLSQGQVITPFPDPSCSTVSAANALTYSPTGASGTTSINGDGHVEISMTGTVRNGYNMGERSSFYTKFKVTSGTASIRSSGAASQILTVDSTVNSDWNYYRSNTPGAVWFYPNTASATVVVDSFVAAKGTPFIRGEEFSIVV